MICGSCKKECFSLRFKINEEGEKVESCNNCSNYSISYIPDVYWPGHTHTNPNITDRMGREIELTSRSHKAMVMKQMAISEAGDRVHGSVAGNYTYTNNTGNPGITERSRYGKR